MWVAGVGWSADRYECLIVDGTGHPVAQPAVFPASGLSALIAYLREADERADERADGGLVTVIDSTNGLLDGFLTAAGLAVYRADPPSLPSRPPFGSVGAHVLAGLRRSELTRLSSETGALAGRADEYAAALGAAAGTERRLASGGWFVEHGPRQRPEVALTFDDGPDDRFTGAVLDILRAHGVTATFFCVGMNAVAHPGLIARIVEEGHAIGNHTWSHPYLPDLTRDEVLRQVDETTTAIGTATDRKPTLVRPPYGGRTPEVLEWLAEHGMTTVVWDVDTRDWSRPGTDAIAAATLTGTRPGSVVLMHDGGGERSQTVAALPAVLEGLLGSGHTLVTIDRMLADGGAVRHGEGAAH